MVYCLTLTTLFVVLLFYLMGLLLWFVLVACLLVVLFCFLVAVGHVACGVLVCRWFFGFGLVAGFGWLLFLI